MFKSVSFLAASTAVMLGLPAAANAVPAIGLTSGNALFQFDTATPGIGSVPLGISGLNAGDTLLGLDYRPATAMLYGLSSGGALYTINAGTGAATIASTLSTPLIGNSFDISFNPTVDRLRIVGTSGQDLRVNVDTGGCHRGRPARLRSRRHECRPHPRRHRGRLHQPGRGHRRQHHALRP